MSTAACAAATPCLQSIGRKLRKQLRGLVAAAILATIWVFGAPGGFLGELTLADLRKAGFFAYLAEKR